jgi:hypothetical protein
MAEGPAIPFGSAQAKGISLKANADAAPDYAWIASYAAFGVAFNTSATAGAVQFAAPAAFGTTGAIDIAAADLTGDNLDDIAILKSNGIEIWRNLGGSTPSFSLLSSTPLTGPFRMQIADLNRDNLRDVAITSSAGFKALRNLGGSPPSFTLDDVLSTTHSFLLVEDRDGDTIPEAILAEGGLFSILVFGGAIGGPVTATAPASGSSGGIVLQAALRSGDLNGDGRIDVIRGLSAGFRYGQGSFGITFDAAGTQFALPAPLRDLDIVDLNGDGTPDVVALLSDRIWIGINAATGAIVPSFHSFTLPLPDGGSLIAGRFSNDAKIDLLVTGFSQPRTAPFLQGALSMLLSSSANPLVAGGTVQLQAAALPPAGCPTPAGAVQFSRGATPLGQVSFTNATASLTTALSTIGRQVITATYVPAPVSDPFSGGSASIVQFVDSATCAGMISTAQVIRGGARLDRITNQLIQQVTIQNTGAAPITGPAWIALTGLTPGTLVAGAEFAEGCSVPAGTPLVNVNLCSGGSGIPPGGSATVTLRFTSPQNVAVNYNPVVLSGFMPR